jgi:protein-disulfide isomerase
LTRKSREIRIVFVNRQNTTKLFVAAILIATIAFCAGLASCSGTEGPRFVGAKKIENKIDLSELTPLEIKVFEKVVNDEVSPCGDDVTLAESLFNPKHCPLAPRAGRFVTGMVMEDYNAEEISKAYMARYAHIKGLEIPVDGSPVTGSKNPIITLVVFTDFECPFCAKAAREIHDILRRYPGEIAAVHKNFPIRSHRESEPAARAAFAAYKQGKFWQMHDVLFSAQGSPLDVERFELMAAGIGLDIEKFKEDFGSEEATAAIAADVKLAGQLGVNGTPTMFINGRLIENGINGLNERIAEEFLRNGK